MILIGLGANIGGSWGDPKATLNRVYEILEQNRVVVKAFSPLLISEPLGPSQPPFTNAAALVETAMPASNLLLTLKIIEAKAGRRAGERRFGKRWGARPLDLDLLSYHGLFINWDCFNGKAIPRYGYRLILPHPELHKRPFVLKPLSQIAPAWRHPLFKLTAKEMLKALKHETRGRILGEL